MKTFISRGKKWFALLALALVPFLGGVLWLERTPLLAWYHVRALARAGDGDRQQCVERVVSLGGAAVGRLVGALANEDPHVCANIENGLAAFFAHGGWKDSLSTDLAVAMAEAFGRSSLAGQRTVLRLEADWLRPRPKDKAVPRAVLEADTRLAQQAVGATGKEVRTETLRLIAALLTQPVQPDLAAAWREATRSALRDSDADVRAQAVQVAQSPALGMLEQVAPLLHDSAPQVRRMAILAVGPSPTAISSEELLPWLHDADPEVRRLCEVALRTRSDVTEENLRLGRLITDPRPSSRMQAIGELLTDTEREPSEWLRRLSHDPVPSVRVAAIRAAVLRPRVDLSERIQEMTRSDPSPSVCQLAQFYLDFQDRQKLSRPEN